MIKKYRSIALLLMLISLHSFVLMGTGFAQQVMQEEKSGVTQEEESQDKITPGAQNIKESIGIFVFVVWILM